MAQPLKFTSPAFSAGAAIPAKFTCEGANVSPMLEWGPAPQGALSWALLFDDPDDTPTTWSHWVLFNLPVATIRLEENLTPSAALPGGAVQGTNDFKNVGYGGPCPPTGTHHYYFRLYALDRKLALGPSATRQDLLKAIQGHVLAQAELMGTYLRTKK